MEHLSADRVRRLAFVDEAGARDTWARALDVGGQTVPPFVSLLKDWSEFSNTSVEELLEKHADLMDDVLEDWFAEPRDSPEEVVAFYDRPSDWVFATHLEWHAFSPHPPVMAAAAIAVLQAAGVKRVLDIGCGPGSTSLALARAGMEVGLVDVSEGSLNLAEWRLRRRELAPGAVFDGRESGLEDERAGSWDGAVLFNVLEHVQDPVDIAMRMHRLLRPFGMVALTQVYHPEADGTIEYRRTGEVVVALAARGYRITHVRGVAWFAQKDVVLPDAARRHAAALKARFRVLELAQRGPDRVARKASSRWGR